MKLELFVGTTCPYCHLVRKEIEKEGRTDVEYLNIDENEYLVVMTSGHSFDFAVERQVLMGDFAYVGVIGSRSKTASVNARLWAAGVSEEKTSLVHTPIGTAIRAVTPQEIAVSIAGEMILERAIAREGAAKQSHSCPMK